MNYDQPDDLPPFQYFNKKKHQKVDPVTIKSQLVKPELMELQLDDPLGKIFQKDLTQSQRNSPKNASSSKIPGTLIVPVAIMKDVVDSKLEIIKKNRNIQRTTRVEKEIQPLENATEMEIHLTNEMINKVMNQMINKTAAKNVSDQIIPISVQKINRNIEQLKKEINQLLIKGAQVQSQLDSNPRNPILEKQKQVIQKQIQKLNTLSCLYFDKIEMRFETKNFLNMIQGLKQENSEIKRKLTENIERNSVGFGGVGNAPAQDRERNLRIELNLVKKELEKEKKMRIDMEDKVHETIQDFSRLYEEADNARKIMAAKLKEIQLNEQELEMQFISINKQLPSHLAHKQTEARETEREKERSRQRQKQQERELQIQRERQGQPESPLLSLSDNTSRADVTIKDRKMSRFEMQERAGEKSTARRGGIQAAIGMGTGIGKKEMTMEEKINKMRGNQMSFRKAK